MDNATLSPSILSPCSSSRSIQIATSLNEDFVHPATPSRASSNREIQFSPVEDYPTLPQGTPCIVTDSHMF